MTTLAINGAEISFTDQGAGDGVILVHGFAASSQENWGKAGWISMLTRANRRVVAIDLRGHGASAKLYQPTDYSIALMAGDVLALSEHLQLKKPDLIGFSLGARVVLELLRTRGERFLLGVLCGVGDAMINPREERDPALLANAMEAASAPFRGLVRRLTSAAGPERPVRRTDEPRAGTADARGKTVFRDEWNPQRNWAPSRFAPGCPACRFSPTANVCDDPSRMSCKRTFVFWLKTPFFSMGMYSLAWLVPVHNA